MSAFNFDIVPIDQAPLDQVLKTLDRSLGQEHSEAWYRWKHKESPFGPSLGWVALGSEGVLGVRLFMRWTLQVNGVDIEAVRPVDTATAPEARKHGIFRSLTEYAVSAIAKDSDIALIFNTPNANSRLGYQRMGWRILPPLSHGVGIILFGRSATLARDEQVFNSFSQSDMLPDRLGTSVNAEYIRWRYSAVPNLRYQWARLSQADVPNGIIYRVVERRFTRLLIVNELVGTPIVQRLLLRSVARQEGAAAFVVVTGSGARHCVRGPLLRRGGSVLAVRPLRPGVPNCISLGGWALTLGDLERLL